MAMMIKIKVKFESYTFNIGYGPGQVSPLDKWSKAEPTISMG